jgi:hypothetical protein
MTVVLRKDELCSSFFLWLGILLIFLPYVSSYTLIFSWLNFHDDQRLLTVFSALLFFLAFSFNKITIYWFDVFYLKVVISVIAWLSVVSVFSQFPVWSFVEVFYLSNIFLFSFAIAAFFEGRILFLVKYSASILIIFFSVYYFNMLVGILYLAVSKGSVDAATLVSGYVNFRFLNQVQVFLFPFLLFGSSIFGKKLRVIIFVILSFTVLILLLTTARGAILSILAATVCLFLADRKSRPLFFLFLASTVSGVVLYFLLVFAIDIVNSMNSIADASGLRDLKLDSSSGRIDMWLEALYLAPDYFFFGSGGLHYPVVSNVQIGAHPHNVIFQFAIEWGYAITIVILLVLFSALKLNLVSMIRFWSAGNYIIYRPFFCSLLALLIYSMFSGVLAMPLSSQSFILALSGVIHFFRRLSFHTHGETLSVNAFRVRVLVIGVSLLLYWALMFPQVYSVMENQKVYDRPFPSLYAPRLWLDGVIR